ncbi:MAG TPA: tRNA lysidine(34) synthetase TilS, partial [Bauldia sp.]|nr:tRNA lysidine(34) synthetase TilS [Bauldia sp.]
MIAAVRPDAGAAALSEAEVAALFAPLASSPAIAIAVSGGADSLALLAVADRWRRAPARPKVIVLTVDHGLSPGSAAVAARVAAIAADRGLAVRVLAWTGPKPRTDIEAAARDARYRLLAAAAREAGATHLLTAHSLDDQAETFLMRLGRGSGVFGLAAMRQELDLGGLVLFRPFLGVARARLASTTVAAGLVAYDDPMNADPRFLRVRVRQLLPALAEAGIDAPTLAAAAGRLARAADAIDVAVDALIASAVRVDAQAVVTVEAEAVAAAPAEVCSRLLVRLLLAVGGEAYPPRSERLDALAAALFGQHGMAVKRTLAGVVVERRAGRLLFYRETGRAGLPVLPVSPGFAGSWDHRFRVSVGPDQREGLTVAALGGLRPAGLVRPAGVPAAA